MFARAHPARFAGMLGPRRDDAGRPLRRRLRPDAGDGADGPADLRGQRHAGPRRRARRLGDAAGDRLDRLRPRPRRAAARPAARRRDPRRRARRHVPGRHRRLPRRPRDRGDASSRRGSRRTRRGRAWRSASLVGVAAVWFAGLYQDWLSGTRGAAARPRGRAGRAARRPVRELPQARRRHEGHRDAVRRPRRRPGPPRRGAVHRGGRASTCGRRCSSRSSGAGPAGRRS